MPPSGGETPRRQLPTSTSSWRRCEDRLSVGLCLGVCRVVGWSSISEVFPQMLSHACDTPSHACGLCCFSRRVTFSSLLLSFYVTAVVLSERMSCSYLPASPLITSCLSHHASYHLILFDHTYCMPLLIALGSGVGRWAGASSSFFCGLGSDGDHWHQ